MKTFLIIVELLSALGLIITILMHSPKGEGLAGIGGQARMYRTKSGLEDGLNKVTYTFAFIFLLTAGIFGVFY